MTSNFSNSATLPNFLVVGTAKAGTTSIFRYLQQHAKVSIPMKETFFFLKDVYDHNHLPYPQQRPKEDLILNEKSYLDLYPKTQDKIVGEIGTGYLYYFQEAIPRIKQYLGSEVKIAIVLRNPVTRTFSSYQHFRKDMHETLSFEDSLAEEAQRKAAKWDFMWHHKAMSLYADQVEAYMAAFPNVKVFFYEDLSTDPKSFMESLYEFIGVDAPENIDYTKKFNSSGEARSKSLQRLVTQENTVKWLFRPLFRTFFNAERRERIRKFVKNKNMTSKQSLSDDQRAALEDFFAADIQKLSHLLNRETPWPTVKSQAEKSIPKTENA